jgi:hypothetical protein
VSLLAVAVTTAVTAVSSALEHHKHHHHRHHRRPKPPLMTEAVASWYDDAGQTASGIHYTYGFAALILGSDWGRRILFCYRRCVVGRLDDHGPYVGGRTFDLNPALKTATGCPDLCTVRWRYA